jgi:hypothetical protein
VKKREGQRNRSSKTTPNVLPLSLPVEHIQLQVRLAAPVKEKELTRAERREMKKQKKTKGLRRAKVMGKRKKRNRRSCLKTQIAL